MTDFDDHFSDLGYNSTDPNWKTPQEWLNEDASDPGYKLRSDQDIIETVAMNKEDSDSEDDDPAPFQETC